MRPESKFPNPNVQSPISGLDPCDLSVVIVAHGERGGADAGQDTVRNQALDRHRAQLAATGVFRSVSAGVLNGGPTLENALDQACSAKPHAIAIYPFFMADGYFVKTVLPKRLTDFSLSLPHHILQPLGHEPNLVHLIVARAVDEARGAKLEPKDARLLMVGHGSKFGPASANATRAAATQITRLHEGVFGDVEVAFLEEAPFLSDQLAVSKHATIVSGFFNGDGLHAGEDVPNAIAKVPGQTIYTGAIGAAPDVSDMIQSAVLTAVAAK